MKFKFTYFDFKSYESQALLKNIIKPEAGRVPLF